MSYDIVKRCKHLPNGDFLLSSAANNVTPQTFEEWTCRWFRIECPGFTPEQREAAFVLKNHDAGTKFQPKRWQNLTTAAGEYKASLPEGCEEVDGILFNLQRVDTEDEWIKNKVWDDNRMEKRRAQYDPKDWGEPCKDYTFRTHAEYVEWRNRVNRLVVDNFIAFLKTRVTIKARIFLGATNVWVIAMHKRSFRAAKDKGRAKVFSGTLPTIQSIADRFPDKYGAQVVEVKDEAQGEEQEGV